MPSCGKCGGEAVVQLPYTKTDLCRNCFCDLFEQRVRRANRDFQLIRRGEVVAVAVSGGKDSQAMLFVLHKLAKEIGNVSLKPVLIDEGIEGYRNVAAENAKKLCEQLGFELTVASYKNDFGASMDEVMHKRDELGSACTPGFEPRPSCSYCGVFRKHSLNKAALGLGANKLAVGHNADDLAQTFLMNLMRSEPARLAQTGAQSGVVERDGFVMRVKPLIYNLEIECAVYCRLNGIAFHLGGCPYANESFRGAVKDFLNSAEGEFPGVKFNLLHSFLKLREKLVDDAATEEASARKQMSYCSECGAPYAGSGATCKACEFLKELRVSPKMTENVIKFDGR